VSSLVTAIAPIASVSWRGARGLNPPSGNHQVSEGMNPLRELFLSTETQTDATVHLGTVAAEAPIK
jgi:hypothetical protein